MKRIGVVSRFGGRGFGFLTDLETSAEYFVHVANVLGRVALAAGQRVEFELHPFPKHDGKAPQAINVRPLPSSIGGAR
jgi:cold shock CspA family protein